MPVVISVTVRRNSGCGTRSVPVVGTRTPFLLSGTGYGNLLAHDLGRMAIKGLLVKVRAADQQRRHLAADKLIFGVPG